MDAREGVERVCGGMKEGEWVKWRKMHVDRNGDYLWSG